MVIDIKFAIMDLLIRSSGERLSCFDCKNNNNINNNNNN